jgi:RimJ/RimL family protein N-acetyltransferase
VAERLGFRLESVLPAALRFARRADDVALYSVTARDWRRD